MSSTLEEEIPDPFSLRDYQEACLNAIENNLIKEMRDQLIILPTGAGKTIIFSELIRRKKLKTLVIAHRLELLEQAEAKLKLVAPDIESGVFCSARKELGKQVTIASIQSASSPKNRELFLKEDFELLIIDEAHHAAARTYLELMDYLGFKQLDKVRNNKASTSGIVLGFTATAKRGDRKALKRIFDSIAYELKLEELVSRGFLARPKGLHVTVDIDLEDVQTVMGDYKKLSLRKVMTSDPARKIVVKTIKKFASERKGIVFSCDIEHAELLQEDIENGGFTCKVVHSNISLDRRKKALKDFSEGNVQFLINPMILTEGFDCPVADCMINAAPTQNKPLYIQKAGRVLRLHPEKDNALLIDFGYAGAENPLQTAQTLGSIIEVKKVDDKLELMSASELEAYEKEQEEIAAQKRKEGENLKLAVTREAEYDPLKTPEKEEQEDKNKKTFEGSRGRGKIDEADMYELIEFLKQLDVPTLRSSSWSKDISRKQIKFSKSLCVRVGLKMPRLISEISCFQGSKLIKALLEKDKGRLEVTERQIATLHNIGIDREKAARLSFKDASHMIWSHQMQKSEACRQYSRT
ncbi:MAG: DEAD/DEAH box helicase [Chlamydiota bacterium]